jgi:hypothetical protein
MGSKRNVRRVRQKKPNGAPLVINPKSQTFSVDGPSSSVEVTITALPNQTCVYRFDWLRFPTAGKEAVVSAHVHLKQGPSNGDSLPLVRRSSLVGNTIVSSSRLRSHQVEHVDDFSFVGKIVERSK